MKSSPVAEGAQAGARSLRETAKWTVGGLAAVAAAVIAGSPLTGLGSLDLGWRLFLAILGAVVGFVALGYVVWHSIDLMMARALTFDGIVKNRDISSDRQAALNAELAHQFPNGMATFQDIDKHVACLKMQRKAADATQIEEINRSLEQLTQESTDLVYAFGFEEIRERFLRLRRRMAYCAFVIMLGFGLFAWAANPPKDRAYELSSPYVHTLTPNPDDLTGLRVKLTDACLQDPLQILVLHERASGNLEGVLLGSACPHLWVTLHNRATSIAIQR